MKWIVIAIIVFAIAKGVLRILIVESDKQALRDHYGTKFSVDSATLWWKPLDDDPDAVMITHCSRADDSDARFGLILPDQIEGRTVVAIRDFAFAGCDFLTSLTLPRSVKEIGEGAFASCDALTEIKASMTNSFFKDEDGVLYSKSGDVLIAYPAGLAAESFVVPDGVTTIGDSAFSGCSSLSSLTLPEGVTTIGDWAFSGCESLNSISFPEGLTTIGEFAFSDCESLSSISLPESVTTIGKCAFLGCSSLTSIVVSPTNESYKDLDGVLYSKDGTLLIAYPAGREAESYVVSDGVTTIGKDAFSGCSSLSSLTLPESVTTIGKDAFSGCSSLSSLTLPESVTTIGDSAFWGCKSLKSISLPEGLTTIGEYAFSDCGSLSSISLPASVTTIGKEAFSGCSSLSSLTLPGSVEKIGAYAFNNCSSLSSLTLPEGVKEIGKGAFSGVPKDCVFRVVVGSYAARWARKNGFRVETREE